MKLEYFSCQLINLFETTNMIENEDRVCRIITTTISRVSRDDLVDVCFKHVNVDSRSH